MSNLTGINISLVNDFGLCRMGDRFVIAKGVQKLKDYIIEYAEYSPSVYRNLNAQTKGGSDYFVYSIDNELIECFTAQELDDIFAGDYIQSIINEI